MFLDRMYRSTRSACQPNRNFDLRFTTSMVTASVVGTDRNWSTGMTAAKAPEAVKNRSVGNNGLSTNELTIKT